MRSGEPAPESVQQRRSLILDSWAKYTSNRFALAGSIILAFFVVVALSAQTIAPFNPFSIVGKPLQAPTPKFLMGTDNIGRDIFSQFVLGSQISLSVGLAAAFFSTLIGIVVGSVAGFFGSYV